MAIPEHSTFTCAIRWRGDNRDYDTFARQHDIVFPGGLEAIGGGAHRTEVTGQTNPEELFAASVATCMMMTILAVFSRSKIVITAYEDTPEASLDLVERRYRITRVTLRPRITVEGDIDPAKFENLISKSHANCFISLSVNSEVIVEPTFIKS